MTSITQANDQFETFLSVMQTINQQTSVNKSTSLRKSNKKNLYQEEKVYVKLENKQFTANTGIKAKRTKETTVVNLAVLVEETIESAIDLGLFKRKTTPELNEIIKGMEILRERIHLHTECMSSLKRFFLRAFGYLDKYDTALKKIDHAIYLSKKNFLPKQIEDLKKQQNSLSTTVNELSIEVSNLKKQAEKSKDVEQQQKLENQIKSAEGKIQDLKNKKGLLTSTQLEIKTKLTPFRQIENQLEQAKTRLVGIKKEKGIGFFGTNTEGKKALKLAEKAVDEASTSLKKQTKIFENTLIELKDAELAIKNLEKEEQVVSQDLATKKNSLTLIQKRQSKSQEKEKELQSKQLDLNKLQKTIDTKQKELAKIKGEAPYFEVNIPSKKVNQKLFDFPSTTLRYENEILGNIQASLGFNPNKMEPYFDFQRRLIFGFSVGQKKAIEELDKQINFNLKDLEKMLNGGISIVNMFYVVNYLNSLIATKKTEGKDTDYIQSLEKLQADLKRSLPFAFRAYTIGVDRENLRNVEKANPDLKLLVKDMSQKLANMAAGERLLVPTGTYQHATLLSFQKMENGEIVSTLYNTGEGVEQHVTKGLNLKTITDELHSLQNKFPTSKVYPPFKVTSKNENFETMMVEILKTTFTKNSKVEEMNTTLSTHLGEGKSGPAKPVQINGICTFQVLSEAFKDILGSKLNYNTYKRDLLSHIQQEFQQITDAMKPLVGEDLEKQKLLVLHQALLEDNQNQLKLTEKLLTLSLK